MAEATVHLRPLHPGQVQAVEGAKRFNVAMCGRRFGKTALGIDVAINAVLDGKLVGWFAPTYKILNPAFDELEVVLRGVPGYKKMEAERTIRVAGGGSVECWSMDTPDPGRSRKYHVAVIDEAGLQQNLAQVFNDSIRLTLADYEGSAWFLGTPKGIGDFAAFFAKGQNPDDPEWKSFRLPTMANPFIRASEIEAMRAGLPESSFRQEVLAEIVDNGEHPIGLEHIAACVALLGAGPAVAYGVDLARAVDFTAEIGINKDGHVCRVERWKSDWGLTKQKLEAHIGTVLTYADSTGVGDPVVEDLQRAGMRVVGKVFTARFKQQIIENLIVAVQQHRVKFPDGWLRAELDALRADKTALHTRYAAPEGTDIHDDGVMALALAWDAYKDTYHVPKEKPVPEAKLQDRAPHFNGKTGKFERKDSLQVLDQMLGYGRRPPLGWRPPRRGFR